jgi:hypothetical protein
MKHGCHNDMQQSAPDVRLLLAIDGTCAYACLGGYFTGAAVHRCQITVFIVSEALNFYQYANFLTVP